MHSGFLLWRYTLQTLFIVNFAMYVPSVLARVSDIDYIVKGHDCVYSRAHTHAEKSK